MGFSFANAKLHIYLIYVHLKQSCMKMMRKAKHGSNIEGYTYSENVDGYLRNARDLDSVQLVVKQNYLDQTYLLYEEQLCFSENMSRSPPPRPWYSSQSGSASGPPHLPGGSSDRRSPGYDRGPPPEWFRWQDQHRGRTPPRDSHSERSSTQRPPSPLSDRNMVRRSPSPRNDRSLSPRHEQVSSRRPQSPIRPPSPIHAPSPQRERPVSPGRERLPSPRRDRPPSPRWDRPLSPRRDRPPSPRRDRPPSPRRDRPPSPRRDRPPSPRRDMPPSPRRDRPASPRRDRPLSPRRDRPPSPYRERPISPYDWRPRSPHRYLPPPNDWGRGRSPPHWARRSPPRYLPRGRSPPRGHWGPPPPEWDRYHGPPPRHRSPPRWGPPPAHFWERRWPPGPPPSGPPPVGTYYKPSSSDMKGSLPNFLVEPKQDNKGDDGVLTPSDDKEDEIESFDLPEYDPEVPLGQKYVIAVSGFFCKICHKFYNSESSAKITHCKSKNHYEKFAKWLSEKRVAALVEKRSVSATQQDKSKDDEEPHSKKIKLELHETENSSADNSGKYDPAQPTIDAVSNIQTEDTSTKQENGECSVEKSDSSTAIKLEDGEVEQNGGGSQPLDYNSDSEALITNEVKKVPDDFVEATLYNLRKMKVNQLKANLEKRGMKSTGLKPLLLKRLEKVLAEEASAAAESEQNTEEEQKQNEGEETGETEAIEDTCGKEYLLKLHESDVEPANRKTQWITDRELERELLQLKGVKKVLSSKNERSRVFNGRRTNVEWTIRLLYDGEITEEGLKFSIPSHQQLPFIVMLAETD